MDDTDNWTADPPVASEAPPLVAAAGNGDRKSVV